MANLKIWSRVPQGSTLELSAASPEETFDVRARYVPTDGNSEVWLRPDLVPGPKRKRLTSTSVVRLLVSFLSAEEQDVEVRARVVKPNGTVHGDPYRETFRGKGGDEPVRVTLVIALREEA